VRRFIHLRDAHSKQWAALNASSLWAYLVVALDNIHEVHLQLIGINFLPGFLHIILACGLSMSAANGRDFMVSSMGIICRAHFPPEFGLEDAKTIAFPHVMPELCYISTISCVLDKTSNSRSSAGLLVSSAISGIPLSKVCRRPPKLHNFPHFWD